MFTEIYSLAAEGLLSGLLIDMSQGYRTSLSLCVYLNSILHVKYIVLTNMGTDGGEKKKLPFQFQL